MLTLKQAMDYLQAKRNMKVSRQTLYTYAQQHASQCEKIAGKERPVLFLIPTSLLDALTISERHQSAGTVEKKKKKTA